MRRDALVFDATSSAGNMVIHGGPKSGKSTALQTFILSAAALHSPRDVTLLLPRLRRRATRAARRASRTSAAWRRRWSPSGSAAPSASWRQLLRAAASTPRAHDRRATTVRRGLPGHRQPLCVQPGQHRSVQHPEPVAGQGDRARQLGPVPTVSTSSSPRRTGSRCRWRCATGSGCGWSCELHDARDSNVRVVGALRPACRRCARTTNPAAA